MQLPGRSDRMRLEERLGVPAIIQGGTLASGLVVIVVTFSDILQPGYGCAISNCEAVSNESTIFRLLADLLVLYWFTLNYAAILMAYRISHPAWLLSLCASFALLTSSFVSDNFHLWTWAFTAVLAIPFVMCAVEVFRLKFILRNFNRTKYYGFFRRWLCTLLGALVFWAIFFHVLLNPSGRAWLTSVFVSTIWPLWSVIFTSIIAVLMVCAIVSISIWYGSRNDREPRSSGLIHGWRLGLYIFLAIWSLLFNPWVAERILQFFQVHWRLVSTTLVTIFTQLIPVFLLPNFWWIAVAILVNCYLFYVRGCPRTWHDPFTRGWVRGLSIGLVIWLILFNPWSLPKIFEDPSFFVLWITVGFMVFRFPEMSRLFSAALNR